MIPQLFRTTCKIALGLATVTGLVRHSKTINIMVIVIRVISINVSIFNLIGKFGMAAKVVMVFK
jgi:hypothetical protein